MFSQLCRACLSHLNPGDNVSLFTVEPCQNIFYYRMCNALQLSVEESDKLPRNVCKTCAQEILKFYEFHLMYMESDRKLRQMLGQLIRSTEKAFEESNLVDAESAVQNGTFDLTWKCSKCSASFVKQSQLHKHFKSLHHRISSIREDDSSDQKAALMESIEVNGLRDNENYNKSYADSGNDYDFHHTNIAEIGADENKANEMTFEYIKLEPISDHDDYNSELGLVVQQDDSKFNDSLVDHSGMFGAKIKDISEGEHESQNIDPVVIKEENKTSVDEPLPNDQKFGWKCKTCFRSFKTRDLLREHRSTHWDPIKTDPSPGWQCTLCLITFSTRNECRVHRRSEHPHTRRVYTLIDSGEKCVCAICNKTFLSKEKIRRHMQTHRDRESKKRVCNICGATLSSNSVLGKHIRVFHDRVRSFHCTLCSKTFSNDYYLQSHMNRHNDIKPFTCDLCHKSFHGKNALGNHIRGSHRNNKSSLNPIQLNRISPLRQCTFCLITFASRKECQAHRRSEHPYARRSNNIDCVCAICDKKFPSIKKIRKHMETHKDKELREQLCNICGLKFSSTYTLKAHVRGLHEHRHERQKSLQCTFCNKKFGYDYSLKSHMNRHKGIKPFTCDLCNKSFHGKSALLIHYKSIHLKQTFVCKICSRPFNRKYNLQAHMRGVHHL